jgi:hypothetical protein
VERGILGEKPPSGRKRCSDKKPPLGRKRFSDKKPPMSGKRYIRLKPPLGGKRPFANCLYKGNGGKI